jgi:hypothetical protein
MPLQKSSRARIHCKFLGEHHVHCSFLTLLLFSQVSPAWLTFTLQNYKPSIHKRYGGFSGGEDEFHRQAHIKRT